MVPLAQPQGTLSLSQGRASRPHSLGQAAPRKAGCSRESPLSGKEEAGRREEGGTLPRKLQRWMPPSSSAQERHLGTLNIAPLAYATQGTEGAGRGQRGLAATRLSRIGSCELTHRSRKAGAQRRCGSAEGVHSCSRKHREPEQPPWARTEEPEPPSPGHTLASPPPSASVHLTGAMYSCHRPAGVAKVILRVGRGGCHVHGRAPSWAGLEHHPSGTVTRRPRAPSSSHSSTGVDRAVILCPTLFSVSKETTGS